MQNHALKPAIQAFNHDSGFARYSIPVLLSPRQRKCSDCEKIVYRFTNACSPPVLEWSETNNTWDPIARACIPHIRHSFRILRLGEYIKAQRQPSKSAQKHFTNLPTDRDNESSCAKPPPSHEDMMSPQNPTTASARKSE